VLDYSQPKSGNIVQKRCLFLLPWFLTAPAFAQVTLAEPHYYVSTRDRFDAYIFRTYTDRVRFEWLLIDSAQETWSKDPHQWDQSPESYSWRIASGWGRRIVRNTAQFGFETVLREDSRYRPSGAHELRKRILFAVTRSATAYHPDGSVGPAYGRMAAGVIAAATSSTWHPQSIGAGAILGGVGESVIERVGSNLLTEFAPDLKAYGKKKWNRFRTKQIWAEAGHANPTR
jgi:hypothetical protein